MRAGRHLRAAGTTLSKMKLAMVPPPRKCADWFFRCFGCAFRCECAFGCGGRGEEGGGGGGCLARGVEPLTDVVLFSDPPPFCDLAAPKRDTTINGKLVAGHVGKRKGTRQLLFERGWYHAGMVANCTVRQRAAGKVPELDCEKTVLGQLPDFVDQPSLLALEVAQRGHIALFSPKG